MAQERRGERSVDDERVELTPMVDIVFNLLIFFMCATTFRTPEGQLKAWLPKDQGPAGLACGEVREVRIVLRRAGSGRLALRLTGRTLADPSGALAPRSPVWQALHRKLVALRASYRGARPTGLPIVVDARPDVPTRAVISTLNEAVRAGVTDVTFARPE